MAVFRPFKAIRPKKEYVEQVSCLPYDVMNRQEAKSMAENNDKSFLRVIRSEIEFDDSISAYSDEVYKRARTNLDSMIQNEVMFQEKTAIYYIYRQIMKGRAQTGLVGCASIDDYFNGTIKRHESTRKEKETDRIKHFDICEAHTEPVFLAYRHSKEINDIVDIWTEDNEPLYNFVSCDNVTHILWGIFDDGINTKIQELFNEMKCFYIADGHHRSASSAEVGVKRRGSNSNYRGDEEFNYLLAVAFPDNDLKIMDYNRVVKDINGYSRSDFLKKLREHFDVKECLDGTRYKPTEKHTFGMCLENKWYILRLKDGVSDEKDIVGSLDVSILQNRVLGPILGINDPRTDKRIDFIGGIRGLEELERRLDSDMKVAFVMNPTSMSEIMNIADIGKIMPPKSTWFEPKLRSGLFIHDFSK